MTLPCAGAIPESRPLPDTALGGVWEPHLHTDRAVDTRSALPQLLPGRNRLFVTAARAEGPWRLRMAWREGPEWTLPREYSAAIDGTEHATTVETDGSSFPRMEVLEFAVDP